MPNNSRAFIDISGRSWALFYYMENKYLVDTNGNKGPNKFGKDRLLFILADEKGKAICHYDINQQTSECTSNVLPQKVIPMFGDMLEKRTNYCNYPPCYYKSWLL